MLLFHLVSENHTLNLCNNFTFEDYQVLKYATCKKDLNYCIKKNDYNALPKVLMSSCKKLKHH